MGLSIVQVQGRLALTDDSGNVIGVFDDSGDKRILVQALLKAGHGLSTEATLALIKAKTDNLDVALSTRAVTGLTDAQLRATAVPVSAAALPLPSGAATSAAQTTGNNSLSSIDTKTPAVGQAAMAASSPVVLASNQSAIPVTDNAGSLTVDSPQLPAALVGARLDVNAGAWLGSTAPTVGQKAAASSIPVVLASDQSTLPISMAASGYGGQVEGRAADAAAHVGNPVLMGGTDGTLARSILTDANGRLIIAPAGSSALASAGFAFGDATLASTNVAVIRRTTYTEPSSNAQRSVSSNNAADASAGTGARQVRITYYTATWTGPFTETVTMSGTTPVNTVATNICYIEKIEVVSIGSTGSNVGIISLFGATAGGGGTVGTIAATNGRTYWAHHYVPTGKTCFITSLSTSHSGTTVGSGASFHLRAKTLNNATDPENQISDFLRQFGQSGNNVRNYGTPIEVVGPARVSAFCQPESGTSVVFRAAFDFYEQDT